jgi:DNA-binding winged helix-turn-helix (wHTH) protein
MAERILYEFDGFRLDPTARSLSRNDESVAIRAMAFDLLLVFVRNHGQPLDKVEVIKRLWQTDGSDDRNFHVTLGDVRKALGDSAKNPRFIVLEPAGYRFAADVRIRGRDARAHSGLVFHVLVSSTLYAALYGSAVFLEIAYEFDRYRRSAFVVAPIVFGWILLSSIAGLGINRKRVFKGKHSGLTITISVFFFAAALLFGGLSRWLPNEPITRATFQTYPAQAAYLKDLAYFLVLALLFLIIPFHFVTAMEHEIEEGRHQSVLDNLRARKLAVLPRGTIYLGFWHLALLLFMFAVMSIAMTAHLLDNLGSGTYRNLFTQLVYVRGMLYFGLGIECLAWYYRALNDLKREARLQDHQ